MPNQKLILKRENKILKIKIGKQMSRKITNIEEKQRISNIIIIGAPKKGNQRKGRDEITKNCIPKNIF